MSCCELNDRMMAGVNKFELGAWDGVSFAEVYETYGMGSSEGSEGIVSGRNWAALEMYQ